MVTRAELLAVIKARNEADSALKAVRDELKQVERGSESAESSWRSTWDSFEQHATKASLAIAGAGLAVEGFARSQQQNTRDIRVFAEAMGMSEGEARGMATSLSNATFPLDEVIALMDQARRRGLEGEAIKEYASFWDMVGDATGKSGPALGEASDGLRAVGIAAGEEGLALDAFGFIAENTTQDVSDFLTLLDRRGPAIRDFGLDIDDTAAILAVMERELGLTSRTARQQFERAINDSDGTLEGLLATLGVSAESFDTMRGRVEGSGEAIERNAQIYADAVTPMQRYESWMKDILFSHGALIEQAAQLAPLMLAMGPAVKLVSVVGAPTIGFAASLTTQLGEMHRIIVATGGSRGALHGYAQVMRTSFTAALASPLFALGALTAGVVALELGLRAFTGEGLMSRLSGAFRETDYAAEGAADQLERLERVMGDMEGAQAITFLIHETTRLNHAFERTRSELDQLEGHFAAAHAHMGTLDNVAREAAGAFEVNAQAMLENGAAAEEVWEQYKRLPEAVQDAFKEQETYLGLLGDVAEAHDQLGDDVRGSIPAYSDLGGAFEDVRGKGEDLEEELVSVDDQLKGLGGTFRDYVPRAIDEWERRTGRSFDAFRGEIPPTINTVDELARFIDNELRDGGATSLRILEEVAAEAFGALAGHASDAMRRTNETFDEWQERLLEQITNHENMETNIGAILDNLPPEYSDMVGAVEGIFREKGPDATAEFVKHMAENPEEAMQTFLDWLVTTSPEMVEQAKDATRPKAEAFGTMLPEEVARGIDEMAHMVADATQSTVDGAIDGADTSGAAGVGSSMGGGIVSGILSRQMDAATAFRNTVREAIEAGRQEARASSPSREAAERVGMPLSEGVAAGIDEGAPLIERSAVAALSSAIGMMRDFVALEAPTVQEAFLHTMAVADEHRQLVSEYGELGADLVTALRDALAGGDARAAHTLGELLTRMIDDAEAVGIPGARELGEDVSAALALALADGAVDAADAALKLLRDYTDTIAAGVPELEEVAEDAARNTVSSFMQGYHQTVADRRMVEQFGSDGKRMLDALNAELEKGGEGSFDRIGAMTAGMLDRLSDGLDPDGSAHITRVFFDAVSDVIDDQGEAAMQRLRDLLEQIEQSGVESIVNPVLERPDGEALIRLAGLQSFDDSPWSTGNRRIEVPVSELAAAMSMHGLGRPAIAAELAKLGMDWDDVPGFAGGAIVTRPTFAMIGEGGRDEGVFPLPRDWRQRGFGGETTITIAPGAVQVTIEGNADEETTRRAVLDALREALEDDFAPEGQAWGVAV